MGPMSCPVYYTVSEMRRPRPTAVALNKVSRLEEEQE
jgi:hypothetical protein